MKITIRKGTRKDLPSVLALVHELAEYERAPDAVTNTLKMMKRDYAGRNPLFRFFVAEDNKKIVGIALYYIKYSTWLGKCLYLDDIVVTETYRRKNIGSKLFETIILESKKQKAGKLEWQVLDWNEPAIKFYKKYNAHFQPDWITCKLTVEQLKAWKVK